MNRLILSAAMLLVPAAGLAADDERADESHWAFQPVGHPAVPSVSRRDWPTSPIDHFILARLETAGLMPSAETDRRTLLRRVCFDLVGLPPTPGQAARFLGDPAPDAWPRLVDSLLASPHYGQRWGRHWLDVARYADSNGLDENVAYGNAWRYRDWVVDSFNTDHPFDRFVVEQLAGDLITDPAPLAVRHARLIATGFLSLGPKVLAEVDERKMEMDIVDEQVDIIGRGLLGLTLGCARCHDHKFDPVSTEEYYALAGIFKSTRTMENFSKVARWWETPVPTPAQQARVEAHRKQVTAKKTEISELVAAARKALGNKPGSGQTASKDEEQQFPAETRGQLKKLRARLASLEKSAPELPTAMGVTEGTVADARVHVRGSHLELGAAIPRGVPRVVAGKFPPRFPADHSGRRELADWLVRPGHPLTARVFVNRLWRWHFGRGLVETCDNFGKQGDPPTHPHLLDWLAGELVRGGWSVKHLQRTIVMSATYRMQSRRRPMAMTVDPDNRLWWRMPIRRLEAEVLRDSLLAVSGSLDTSMGGSLLHVKNRAYFFDHTSKDQTRYDSPRRSIYLPVVRNHLFDVFTLFDYTDASVINGNRATSTVAPQALFLLNSPLVEQVSRRLAEQSLASPPDQDAERIDRLYRRVLGRPALPQETHAVRQFLADVRPALPGEDPGDLDAWQALSHVLLASNEFIYLR